MALEDGILYALVGEKEPPGDNLQRARDSAVPAGHGGRSTTTPVGIGCTLLAIDALPPTKSFGTIASRSPSIRGRCA